MPFVQIAKKALMIAAAWSVTHGQVAHGQSGSTPPSQPSAYPSQLPQHLGHSEGQVFMNPFVRRATATHVSPVRPPAAAGPETVARLLSQAVELEAAGQIPAAIDRYQRALQSDPSDWHTLVSYARARHRLGDLQGAIAIYRKVLTYYPEDPVALNDLGLCYARQGNLPQAIASLRAAANRHPESKRYRNNLATVLIETNDLPAALATLQEVHADAIARFNLGYLLSQRGRQAEAVEQLQVALELDPSLEPAQRLLSQLPNADAHGSREGHTNHEAQIATRPSKPRVPTPATPRLSPATASPATASPATAPPEPWDGEPTPAVRPLMILQQSAELSADSGASVSPANFAVDLDRPPPRQGVPPDPADYRIPGLRE